MPWDQRLPTFPVSSFGRKGLQAADLLPSDNALIVCKPLGKLRVLNESFKSRLRLETHNSLRRLRTKPQSLTKSALTGLAPGPCSSKGQREQKQQNWSHRTACSWLQAFGAPHGPHGCREIWRCGCMTTSKHKTGQWTWLAITSTKFIRNLEFLKIPAKSLSKF